MTKQVQRRRGTATQHTSFTGAEGELSVNTTNKSVHVHDGSTAGGIELARKDGSNVAFTSGTLDGVTIGGSTAGAGTFTNLTATGTTTLAGASTSANITFGDNDKAIFGAGSDLQIYHSGSASYITENSASGALLIQGEELILENPDGTNYFRAATDGSVKLYNSGAVKLNTTSTGIDVTGTVTADGLTVDGNDITQNGTAPTIYLMESDATDLNTRMSSLGGDFQIRTIDDAKSVNKIRFALDHSTGDISFYEDTGTTAKFFWDASAESLGIGTSSPSQGIHLKTASGNSYVKAERTTSSQGEVGFNTDNWYMYQKTGGSDLHFYNTADRMTIDSSGNVGIGTSSPAQKLHLNGAAENVHLMLTNSTTGSTTNDGLHLITETGTGNAYIIQRENANLIMHTNNTERMRIDSSGNLLVGTTTQLHSARATFDQGFGAAATFNRRSSDGAIVYFDKDGTTVGSIGVNSNRPYFEKNAAGGLTISSSGGNPIVLPTSGGGALSNGLANIGAASYRFKDLYLSGGVYLGGTGAANKLDDYEEGTWTPSVSAGSISGTSISYTGVYRKIGSIVYVYFEASNTAGDINVSSYVQFTGLPFSVTGGDATGTVITEDIDVFDRQGFSALGGTTLSLSNCGSSSGTTSLQTTLVGHIT